METRPEKQHEPESDEELDVMMRLYELAFYLEKNPDGSIKEPYKIVEGAPDWCPAMLEKWKEKRKMGFKVP